ncbi:DUF2891 domain-containing protein [Roseomonas nepalensis]|uniref:DUF2891 domain-containing protein n=1 Tax=Muricoccus nepalensis TaxID=1854500 RepID=A0A502FK75_9PROT|nr:DUF2891 domain-containing protein [Roseomonas nepalensis]TPG49880.1 DUF2891 domain-containing protein [Roseomonas nepalensis]
MLPGPRLTEPLAARLAALALGHVEREYPHKPDHVLAGPGDLLAPSAQHPVFFGSYDWHSCVHAHWTLARLLRRFPAMEPAPAIRALFHRRLKEGAVAAEVAYLARPSARGFERPYGWGWLLALAEELAHHAGEPWSARLEPLAEAFAARLRGFLPLATYPVRTGSHGNTAFALLLAAGRMGEEIAPFARRLYGADRACPAWGEPGGDDFLSPTLVEAALMARLLPRGEFLPWFDAFLPGLAEREPAALFAPAAVSDRTDGKIAHLDGLNLSRAWCWRRLAAALPEGDARRPVLLAAAEDHLAAGLPHVAGHYMGEHWLATFAVLALEG